jgi:transcriptional regulator with XRE-family HTH domain
MTVKLYNLAIGWNDNLMPVEKQNVRPELVNEGFGTRLASVRRAKGVSQSELAKTVGLSRGSISNLETGVQNVQLHQVFAFAHALNTPVNELIPLLRDVVISEDGREKLDEIFLQISRRQLIEVSPLGDNDENA